MTNSLVMFIFLFLTGSNICFKNQKCFLKLKFRTLINSNMWNSMVIFFFLFFFFFLDLKYPFCVDLVQKFKRVSLRQNLVPRAIWICNILWWCSLFSISDLFCKFCPKINLAFWYYLPNHKTSGICYNYKFLNNIPYRSFHWTVNNIPKQEKDMLKQMSL